MLSDADVMTELTDGSGGTLFHNNNDLVSRLGNLTSGPGYLYLLSFSTAQIKSNGAYHRIKVKVNHPGTSVQARHGYFAPAPKKNKK
jgi:VWFA-related protein